jgi:DNA-binding transcriptional regulator YhcF (GntR family)
LEEAGLLESNTRRGTVVRFAPPGMLSGERKRRLQPFVEQLIAESRVLGFKDDEVLQQIQEAMKKFRIAGSKYE